MQYLWNIVIIGLHTYPGSLCPDNPKWIGEADWTFCYTDMENAEDFVTSSALCSSINSTMAMPKTSKELSQLTQFMNTIGKKSAWIYMASTPFPESITTPLPGSTTQLSQVIGLTSPAVFKWLDGSDMTEAFWHGLEPNGDGECVEIIAAFEAWNDLSCFPTQRNTICQAPNVNHPDDSELETTLDPSDRSTPDIIQPETSSSNDTDLVHSTSELPLSNLTQLNSTCSVYTICGFNTTYTTRELSARIAQIQANLAVVRSELSSTRRTKSSAEDPRTSSTSMGILGGIVIAMIYLCICLLDFVKVKVKPTKPFFPHTYC